MKTLSSDRVNEIPARIEAALYQRLAAAEYQQGKLGKAESHVGTSKRLNVRARDNYGLALNFNLLGCIKVELGDYTGAMKHFREALLRLSGETRSYQRAAVLNDLATLYREQRDWKTALRLYRQARDLRERASDSISVAIVTLNIGAIEQLRGDLPSAFECYEQSFRIFTQLRDGERAATALRNLAALRALRDPDEAAATLRMALAALPEGSEERVRLEREMRRYDREQQVGWQRWLPRPIMTGLMMVGQSFTGRSREGAPPNPKDRRREHLQRS